MYDQHVTDWFNDGIRAIRGWWGLWDDAPLPPRLQAVQDWVTRLFS